MSRFLPVLLLLALAAPAGAAEDENLNAFFKAHLEREFKERPLEATRLGDHRFDHLLDDVSPRARAGWLKRYRDTLAALPKKVNFKKLSRSAQIDYEILKFHLERELWLMENSRPFEDNPLVYNDYLTESV